jgi:Ser/Thr protein kinase RdoA (MazF antagonist)
MSTESKSTTYVTVPISHSVLDADALARVLAEHYSFDGAPACQLLYRGMNDIYIVHDRARRYALRAWRTGWRSLDNVTYEVEFLDFLASHGFPVSNAIKAKDGSAFFVVAAPEGPRAVAVFMWADGHKLGAEPDGEVAHAIGATFARMHLKGREFQPSVPRITNPATALRDNVAALNRLVFDRPQDQALYSKVAPALYAAVAAAEVKLPSGPNHGDFHFNNVHVRGNGEFTLLDFDNAGDDVFIQDIACYVWANGYGNYDAKYADAFVAGYETVRPLEALEKQSLDLFLLAKEFRMLSGFSTHVNTIGHAPLRFRSLDWFAASIRARSEKLGLI